MKRINKYILWACACIVLLSSCATNQPIATKISEADYNQRITAETPRYKKKANALGISVGVALPIAGAAIGYSASPVVGMNGNEREDSKIGGAVVGALVGTGLSYVASALTNYGKTWIPNDEAKWVRKAFGPSYNFVYGNTYSYTVIHKAAEKKYVVRDLADVEDFKKAFPNSSYADGVVKQALDKLARADLPAVYELYPKSAHAQAVVDRYVKESATYDELAEAVKKFPQTTIDKEYYFAKLVRNPVNANDFRKRYASSKYDMNVVYSAFIERGKAEDVKRMKSLYGKTFDLSPQILRRATDDIRRNYYLGVRDIQDINSLSALDTFEKKYDWLLFEGKKNIILQNAWEQGDKLYTNGNDVIALMTTLPQKSYAQKALLMGSEIQSLVMNQLQQYIKEFKADSVHCISSKSEEFERWKTSAYSAGMVALDDTLQFLIYGNMQNNSKYDIPVMVMAHGNLIAVMKVESEGFLGTAINLLGAITGVGTSRRELVAQVNTDVYTFPCLRAHSKEPFAILVRIDSKLLKNNNMGLNILDMMKVTNTMVFENITMSSALAKESPTQERLDKQQQWLKYVATGLPEARTYDIYRSKELRQNEWDEEWRRLEALAKVERSKEQQRQEEQERREKEIAEDPDVSLESIGITYTTTEWKTKWIDNIPFPFCNDELKNRYMEVEYSDGTEGYIGKYDGNDYYQPSGGVGFIFDDTYSNLYDAIAAEYFFQKYGVTRSKGKN